MGHIGNCHPYNMAPNVVRRVICLGKTGVIMVTGIGWINGNQWQVPQIRSAFKPRRFHRICGRDHRIGKAIGNAVLVNGY